MHFHGEMVHFFLKTEAREAKVLNDKQNLLYFILIYKMHLLTP